MALRLVTGPANSGKAGVLLGAYRARLDEEPILVVPSLEDVEHTQRELADGGAVFGTRVVRFKWLFEEIANRAGSRARVASALQRELIVEEAVRSLDLQALGRSARRPGFVRAAVRLVAELERSMVEPPRFTRALRDWAGSGPRSRYAEEVALIYSRYRERLEAAGLVDDELYAWRALDALRRDAGAWGETPAFFYGFDDFTPLELDALETLSRIAGADVTVSLPYERGRAAFKAVAGVFEQLSGLAGAAPEELPAVDAHYAQESRSALHHLERSLFGDAVRRRSPRGAIRLLTAGGERAEVELVAAEVLALLRGGTQPGDVAVVYRDPSAYASVVEQVFGAYGIPFSLERRLPFRHTALGRGALALLRCATLDGTDDDLLAYLRTAGKLRNRSLADTLEADVRRDGAETAARARELWEGRFWPLDEIDRIASAAGRGPAALISEQRGQVERLFSAPYERLAHVLTGAEVEDARAFEAAASALDELGSLLGAGAGRGLDARRLHDTLAELPVRLGERPQPDRVLVAAPERIRARRFEAVFVCGLQEGEFPRGRRPEPFLSDDDRRAIASASGLVLPVREDELDRERHLFYVCASRAERRLFISSRFSDEEGSPQPGSFFVEDALELFTEVDTRRRSLSDIVWDPAHAPTSVEFERGVAARGRRVTAPAPDGLRADELLERLGAQDAFSASALETFADCPVKWLVDRLLHPEMLEPDPEQMVRGSYAHEVLELTFRWLRERTGDRRVTRENLAEAEQIMREALRERQSAFKLSPKQTRVRAAVRRLEFDLLRYLRHEAERDGLFEPAELELAFGTGNGGRPAVRLEGQDISVRGVIDRVDTWNGYALVRDYKSGRYVYRVAEWEDKNRLQAAIYMIAIRELLALEPAGGVYVPLAGPERRPRGLVSAELREELGSDFFDNDFCSREEFEKHLERARTTVCELVKRLRSGDVRPCPETCRWSGGGCQYPSICRHEG
ncbi:MAG TPA: PD-(D/E)XK nuclease family protein [Thermoleophilaceae bacterium]|nr:PD-(D/E)XK nuclease family protein [Thermoleophilaceae bacterium]